MKKMIQDQTMAMRPKWASKSTFSIYQMMALVMCAILFFPFKANAQKVSRSVMALAGGQSKSPQGLSLSWTLGEIIVDPLKSTGSISLLQGYQVPDLMVSTGYADPQWQYSVEIAPNPTASLIRLSTVSPSGLEFYLSDMEGKRLLEGAWVQEHQLDISELPAGSYVLYMMQEQRLVQSSLVIKQ